MLPFMTRVITLIQFCLFDSNYIKTYRDRTIIPNPKSAIENEARLRAMALDEKASHILKLDLKLYS